MQCLQLHRSVHLLLPQSHDDEEDRGGDKDDFLDLMKFLFRVSVLFLFVIKFHPIFFTEQNHDALNIPHKHNSRTGYGAKLVEFSLEDTRTTGTIALRAK